MTTHELGIWLTLGALLAAPFLLLVPVHGGNGQHAHAGPGTLTVAQLSAIAHRPEPDDADIVWPPEPKPGWDEPELTPVERDLHRLLHPPAVESYTGRHRLNEPGEMYSPPPGLRAVLTEPIPA
ncbi:hypothetical protein FHX42_004603 [Saccharopolyspora lacisalsi]|uniref:Uncharacterized protein n=1 Tax=Halosaccharopolyspora lacisalsi TaxID=1000566 RepID=A0A839E2X7_9PSEU|nr:hypothetical protein [Halosaccharopolyspora lacisalsi]MBA8827219.1 hypothetical protein [Halosaccharopolyspora lacisalsi]